jgi:hypothetical protein
MCKYFPIYEEAVNHIWLCSCSILNFLIYEDNLIIFFISVTGKGVVVGPNLTKAWPSINHSILSGAAVYSSTVEL